METSRSPYDDLAAAERAASLPWTEYPPTPAWYPPAVGLFAALLTATRVLDGHGPWPVLAVIALLVVEAVFLGWYRAKRGTMPSFRHVPPEFRRPLAGFVVGTVVVLAVVVAAAVAAPAWVSIGLALVLVTAGVAAYERVYARAAAATRARLA